MKLKRIYIEITNRCNLKCPFCIQNQRKEHDLTIFEFRHIMEEINQYSEYIYLHVLGEPLLHPKLKDILDICGKYHKKVMITTNATLLADNIEILIHPVIQQINLSIHSYPFHHQSNYLEKIFAASEALASKQKHVNYRLWALENNQLDEEASAILTKILAYYHHDSFDLKRMLRVDLKDHIHLHFEKVFEWPSLDHTYVGDRGRCLGLKNMCGILNNGNVVACCLDSKGEGVLGNIFENSFKDIMESKLVEDVKKGFCENKIHLELCKHCSYRLRFSKAS